MFYSTRSKNIWKAHITHNKIVKAKEVKPTTGKLFTQKLKREFI